MTAHACCRIGMDAPRPVRTLTRRFRDAIRWVVPGGVLILLPKCPACLVAYFAVGAGIGISISTATYLRLTLVVLCASSLSYLAASRGRSFFAHRTGFFR